MASENSIPPSRQNTQGDNNNHSIEQAPAGNNDAPNNKSNTHSAETMNKNSSIENSLSDEQKESATDKEDAKKALSGNSEGSPPVDNANDDMSEESGPVSTSQKDQENSASSEKEETKNENPEKSMGLLDHLSELRGRLTKAAIAAAIGFAICWCFVEPLFSILLHPLLQVLPEGTHAQYTTLPEAFFTRMRIAFVAGLFLASPAIFYQIWAFIAPGLYDEEKKYIIPIALLSAIFFIAGALFCYFIVFPFAFNFFISYSTPDIVMTPKISDYLSFCLKLVFAFGLIFEMPIFTLFLARMGIITASIMRRVRKYAIVAIFIIAAILTPPDVVSQILMACPMLLLYEVSIWVAKVFGRKPAPQKSPEDKDGEN